MSKTLTELRSEYSDWRRKAVAEGFKGDFKAACLASNLIAGLPCTTPEQWVDAAEHIFWGACADNQCQEEASEMDYLGACEGITEPWEVANGPRESSLYC